MNQKEHMQLMLLFYSLYLTIVESAILGSCSKPPTTPLASFMTEKFCCMVMRINMDCNGCYRKVRRALLDIPELETHLIEKKQCRVSVCGKFSPQEVAIKIRKKTNRRVEIMDIQEFNANDENFNQRPLMSTWNIVSTQSQIETCIT